MVNRKYQFFYYNKKHKFTMKSGWTILIKVIIKSKNKLLKVSYYTRATGSVFIQICSKFTGKHLCRSVISINLQCVFVQITFLHECFFMNLPHICRRLFTRTTVMDSFWSENIMSQVQEKLPICNIFWLYSHFSLNCNSYKSLLILIFKSRFFWNGSISNMCTVLLQQRESSDSLSVGNFLMSLSVSDSCFVSCTSVSSIPYFGR